MLPRFTPLWRVTDVIGIEVGPGIEVGSDVAVGGMNVSVGWEVGTGVGVA
jgi:hypothetical protein